MDFWSARMARIIMCFIFRPQELAGRETRHWHVSIGHAVSQDLSTWEALPDALAPSQTSGDWDDYTTLTGSIFKHEKPGISTIPGQIMLKRLSPAGWPGNVF